MNFKTLQVSRRGDVVTITLNRPHRNNAMTNLMAAEMTASLRDLASDRSIVVVVVTGEGRGFCPGADLFQLSSDEPDTPIDPANFESAVLLHEMHAVTVAAINGACAGAGLGWAAACDLRYAARSAKFSTAFLARSVAGDMGLPWLLPRIVGSARARELCFFSRKFDAAAAADMGLVNAVFEDSEFRAAVFREVEQLSGTTPAAILALKQNFLAAERMSFRDFIDLETTRHLALYHSSEFRSSAARFAGSTDSLAESPRTRVEASDR
jgi:2-(1,2-epoxy-1,2-dihydrophenyl)acetyl-CoA isomerase